MCCCCAPVIWIDAAVQEAPRRVLDVQHEPTDGSDNHGQQQNETGQQKTHFDSKFESGFRVDVHVAQRSFSQ
jgi:hypothetical protein